MSNQTEYKTLSKRAKSLLSKSENYEVEFKRSANGIKPKHLVSFANSPSGGTILVGVDEAHSKEGKQIGEVVGCDVSDEKKLSILNKAVDCTPSIKIEIIIENLNKDPFFRVEIPSGKHKPYCTGSGTYKIRENGRVKSLDPDKLLELYLEKESEKFKQRFEKATQKLNQALTNVESQTGDLEEEITSKLEKVADELGWASYNADDAVSEMGRLRSKANDLERLLKNIDKRLPKILENFDINDPVKEQARETIKEFIKEKIHDSEEMKKKIKSGMPLSISITHESTQDLSKPELNGIIDQAIEEFREEET